MFSLRIAWRYFFSAKSHGVVNVISCISVAGVAVATAAIIIVLSVFNGFSNLTRSRFSGVDPDLMAVPLSGKVLRNADHLSEIAEHIEGVACAQPTLTERGLIIGNDNSQVGVVFKGVRDNYADVVDIDKIVEYKVANLSEIIEPIDLSIGVAAAIGAQPGMTYELYTLRRVGRINPANPSTAFFSEPFSVGRILRVDQPEFDTDHILISLSMARRLLQYDDNEATAIEIKLKPSANISKVSEILRDKLGLNILTRHQQHAEAYRMISVEKWVTFAMLFFILVIAAFNIASTLSLITIEKQANMATMLFLGASSGRVAGIYAIIGGLITIAGGVTGLIAGIILSLAQEWGQFIKLGSDPSNLTIEAYPVALEWTDVVAVAGLIVLVALLAGIVGRFFAKSSLKHM